MIATKEQRGTKHVCQSETCHRPFYDLKRSEIICPYCGTAFDKKAAPSNRFGAEALEPNPRFGRKILAPLPIVQEEAEEESIEAVAEEDSPSEPASDDILETEDDDGAVEIEVDIADHKEE